MADKIIDIRHPEYTKLTDVWSKWRLTYEGGDEFIEEYVKEFSPREDVVDFGNRKDMTAVPAFAKGAVNEVKNAIYQRVSDVTREGGTNSYTEAIKGELNGVDLNGSTMNTFIGTSVLGELLSMKRVGVYIDMPSEEFESRADVGESHPYIYQYKTEDILSWSYKPGGEPFEFDAVLLRETIATDNEWGLVDETVERYRYCRLIEDTVEVQFFDEDGVQIDVATNEESDITYQIAIPTIPFVIFELSDSLLRDICNYQIALVNLSSSDINYGMKSNFPFYVEQYDARSDNVYVNRPEAAEKASEENVTTNKDQGISVGTTHGRRYPMGAERPGFIAPPSEPLEVSMKKQDQLKEEIRQLMNLTLSNISSRTVSAESKEMDQIGLEAGLSYIGLELESGERKIAMIWSLYEGGTAATISYPKKYSLMSESEELAAAEKLEVLLHNVPSQEYRRQIVKRIAVITLGNRVSNEIMQGVLSEIESAEIINTNPDVIAKDVELGLVSTITASEARGYPAGEADAAKQDHAERLARIQEAQTEGARGVVDSGDPQDGQLEKQKPDDDGFKKDSRGTGDKLNVQRR